MVIRNKNHYIVDNIIDNNLNNVIQYSAAKKQNLYIKLRALMQYFGTDICRNYIDNNICNMVVQGAPVAAALAAFIPDPTVTKVVAVALAAAAGLIGYNNHGRGVIIAFAWIPGKTPVPHWISSQ